MAIGLDLIVGHLVGDFLLQNSWLAKNKANGRPGKEPHSQMIWLGTIATPPRPYPGSWSVDADPHNLEAYRMALDERNQRIATWDRDEIQRFSQAGNDPVLLEQQAWWVRRDAYRRGVLACTLHCLIYTLSVWIFSCTWLPLWALLPIFGTHYLIDRNTLALWLMTTCTGQTEFATGKFSPWSVVAIDQTLHLLVLWSIVWWLGL